MPYVARPVRGIVLSLREREFIQAAIGSGASDWRILRKEILPNVAPSVIVFFPLMVAFNMLTESALSFLGDRRPAAQRQLGHDHQRRPPTPLHAAVGGHRAGHLHRR